jgi:hypothetical protein
VTVAWPPTAVASSDAPAVRAKHLQLWLATARRRLPSSEVADFAKRIPGPLLVDIERLTGPTWLNMELDVAFAEAMREAIGPSSVHRFYIELTLATFGGPLVGPLVRRAIRLSGATPGVATKWWPRGWAGLFRNCGSLSGEVLAPGRAQLVYAELPRACVASPPWVDSLRSALCAVFELCRVGGDVRLRPDVSRRRVQLDVDWDVTHEQTTGGVKPVT